MTKPRRRRGRPRRGASVLDRPLILRTALALVDRDGVQALSLRKLAARLGVDPMALYHHVPGKRELIAGLVRLVFREFRLPRRRGRSWKARVRVFASAYLGLARRHPHLVLHLVSDLEAGAEAILPANEELYAALETSGLPPGGVALAADVVVDYLNGLALMEVGRGPSRTQGGADLAALVKGQPVQGFPALQRALRARRPVPKDPGMAGLELILCGIDAHADKSRRRRRASLARAP